MDILQFMPKGKIWYGQNARAFFHAIEDVFKRVQKETDDILNEVYPDSTKKLLPDWMRLSGESTPSGIIAVLRATGGNTAKYFLDIARSYDENCEIFDKKKSAFVAGRTMAGSKVGYSYQKFTVTFLIKKEDVVQQLEEYLYKIKPAHVEFEYIYPKK